MIEIRVDEALSQLVPNLRLGVIAGYGGNVGEHDAALAAELAAVTEHLRATWGERPAATRPEIAATRMAYRRLGDDPTHYRPSNEALLRRVLLNKPLPQINTAVDTNTLISLQSGWSLGCYDLSAIHGPVTVRQAQAGESYVPIGKPPVDARHRLVLCDGDPPGTAIFGCPTADSARTQVYPGRRDLLFVIFAFDAQIPQPAITESCRLLVDYCAVRSPVAGVVAP